MEYQVRMNRSLKLFVPTILAAALAACGGGGGDDQGGSTSSAAGIPTSASGATGDITAANYTTVALQVRDVLDAGAGAAGAINPMGSTGGTAAGVSTASAAMRVLAAKATQTSFGRRAALSADGTNRIQAVETITEACSGGGTASLTFNDADNNQQLSAGDVVTISAANCTEEGDVINGQASVSILALSETQVSMTMQFSNLRMNDETLNGSASLSVNFSGYDFTGQMSLTNVTLAKTGYPTVKVSFVQNASYKDSTRIVATSNQGGVVFGNDAYWMSQIAPFQSYLYGNYPFAGSLAVTDKDGDRVVGVATTTSMRYEYYRAGNTSSTPDAVTEIPNS